MRIANREMRRWCLGLGVAMIAATLGCAEEDERQGEGVLEVEIEIGGEGLEAISGASLVVDRCEGPRGEPWSVTAASLSPDIRGSGLMSRRQGQVLESQVHARDAGGSAVVGETTIRLRSGCYRVEAVAIDDEGEAVEHCRPLEASRVSVADGAHRHLRLKGRCEGDGTGDGEGGLHARVRTNEAPTIEAVDYDPSRTVSCGERLEICVEATDPDGDPLSYQWRIEDEQVRADEVTQRPECVAVESDETGAYVAQVVVRDLLFVDGQWMSMEAYLQDEMGQSEQSRASLEIPFRVMGCGTQ